MDVNVLHGTTDAIKIAFILESVCQCCFIVFICYPIANYDILILVHRKEFTKNKKIYKNELHLKIVFFIGIHEEALKSIKNSYYTKGSWRTQKVHIFKMFF